MTSITLQKFENDVLTAAGPLFVLFGQSSDPETGRIAKVLAEADVPWLFCDIDSSDGAQVAMRATVRQSPVVIRYSNGFASATYEPAGILSPGVFNA